MAGKRPLTLLFLPLNPDRRAVRITINPFALAIVFCAILFLASNGTWNMYRYYQVSERSLLLQNQNQLAEGQLKVLKGRMDYLNKELLKIKQKASYIQKFLGVKPKVSGSARIGQGGAEIDPHSLLFRPELFSMEHHQPTHLPTLAHTASLSNQDISELDADLEQIIGTLQIIQKRLNHMPSISPVDPSRCRISSPFGMRISPFSNKKQFHLGIDIAGCEGTPIMAPARGKVVFVGKNGSLGSAVRIKHASDYETVYGHLKKATVKQRQLVQRGEVIGYMGNTGKTTGYHLHYEIEKRGKKVNPFEYMMDWESNNFMLAGSQ